MECSCERCRDLCRSKPGWFAPEQIRPLAERLNLTIGDLFRKHLTIDAVLMKDKHRTIGIYVLAPAMVTQKSGTISDPTTRGACVWFKDGRCEIHEVKPLECRSADHLTTPHDGNLLRASLLKRWIPHKKFVQDLYGKKLKPPDVLRDEYRKATRERKKQENAARHEEN